jgi:hypothetical protein
LGKAKQRKDESESPNDPTKAARERHTSELNVGEAVQVVQSAVDEGGLDDKSPGPLRSSPQDKVQVKPSRSSPWSVSHTETPIVAGNSFHVRPIWILLCCLAQVYSTTLRYLPICQSC